MQSIDFPKHQGFFFIVLAAIARNLYLFLRTGTVMLLSQPDHQYYFFGAVYFCPADTRLHGQVELLALHDLGPVDVEEVGVKDGLDEAGDDGDGVEEALHCVSAKGN